MFNATMFLATLGLTKKSAGYLGLAIVARRIFILGYEEASLAKPLSEELRDILGDRTLRALYVEVGKRVDAALLDKSNLFDMLMGVADEHSATLTVVGEQLAEKGDIVLNDELVDTFIGEAMNYIRHLLESTPEDSSLDQPIRPLTVNLVDRLKLVAQTLSVIDVFPDIFEHLTPRPGALLGHG